MAVLANLANSSTRQKGLLWEIGRTRYIRRHSPTYFARTRQTRPHSPKGFFEKNVTRLDTFARVIRHSGEFGASGHCLIYSQSFLEVML